MDKYGRWKSAVEGKGLRVNVNKTKGIQFFLFYFMFFYFIFLIEIHFMQGQTATPRHGVTGKRSTKRLNHMGTLFGKNLQLIGVS